MATSKIHKLLTKTHTCLAKDSTCNKIISAHSIPKYALSKIAEDHKVYSYAPMSHEQLKDIRLYHRASPRKLPISRISTFSGFCGRHDNDLFEAIDNHRIIPTQDQSVRLMLRAVAKNCYDALRAPEIINAIYSRARPKKLRKTTNEGKTLTELDRAAATRELTRANLVRVLDILRGEKFDQIQTLFLRIDQVPDVMCCDLVPLVYDPVGQNVLREGRADLKNSRVPLLGLTMSSDELGGFVHIAWLKGSPIVEHFIDSLRNINYDLNSLTKLIFTYLHNFAFRISWWDNLSVIRRKTLMELCSYSVHTCYDSPDFQENVRPLLTRQQRFHKYRIVEARYY